MQTQKAFKGFYFFYKGLQYANAQMWVSLQVLVVLTGVLAVVLYFVEHAAQIYNAGGEIWRFYEISMLHPGL